MTRNRQSTNKRQREQAKRERKLRKAERRLQRAAEKQTEHVRDDGRSDTADAEKPAPEGSMGDLR